MKILVTGGTGFVGKALLPRLSADGHDVTVLTRGIGPRPFRCHTRYRMGLAMATMAWGVCERLEGLSLLASHGPSHNKAVGDLGAGRLFFCLRSWSRSRTLRIRRYIDHVRNAGS